MQVFAAKIRITKEEVHKHLRFDFNVPEDARRLNVHYSYSPKKYAGSDAYAQAERAFVKAYPVSHIPLESDISGELPLNNHVTLSLDCGGKLVGTAHRHENEATYFVTESEASAGFTPTAIGKGEWSVVLSTHAVLDEVVNAVIEVDAE